MSNFDNKMIYIVCGDYICEINGWHGFQYSFEIRLDIKNLDKWRVAVIKTNRVILDHFISKK